MTSLTLYSYQQESLDRAKQENTIINLETGRGKTLIAAKLIEYYLQKDPTKRVAFLVPTRALAEQQSAYLSKHCKLDDGSPPTIQKLVGYDQAGWDQSDWDDCMEKNHILLGTAALFQTAFVSEKRVDICKFSLLVFDECHNAIGNSPMAAVLKDAVAPYQASGFDDGPRILGLTASFVNGSLKNIEKKRRLLEALMLSTIFCPNVTPKTTGNNFHHIQWDKSFDDNDVKEVIEEYVEEAVDGIPINDISKVVKRCIHVFDHLGRDAVMFYIDKVIVAQIKAKAKLLLGEPKTIRLSTTMIQYLPTLKAELASLTKRLSSDSRIQKAPPTTRKANKLVQLLKDDFQNHGPEHRGIVFVEQVALVSSLAKVLNDAFRGTNILCGAVSGTGYQIETDRQTQLNKFRNGELRILAATAALEEGIDVTECAFVVRYTCIATTKAHIQGAGRARHPNAKIYYFENNPHVERQKEASLIATAKNMSLSLTKQELQNAVISNMTIPLDQRHPYPFRKKDDQIVCSPEGEVNVYNCKQIFNTYCSIVLGASIQPNKILYKYSSDFNNTTFDTASPKFLSSIRFPTPYGWQSIRYTEYKSFWKGVNFDIDVFDNNRIQSKRKSSSDKEEMCFVYLVVIYLRQQKYLDDHNRPNPNVIQPNDVRRLCPNLMSNDYDMTIQNQVFQSY